MQSARQVVAATTYLAPPDIAPADQKEFIEAALGQLKQYADRTHAVTIAPADVPAILAPWLRAVGVDPIAAAARLTDAMMKKGDRPAGGPSDKPPATRATARSTQAKTGKDFVEGEKKKRAAAAAAPAGAGAPAGGADSPPPNQTIAERVEWYAKRKGLPITA